MFIAYREARETGYWIKLLKAVGYLRNTNSIDNDLEELTKILGAILKTTRN